MKSEAVKELIITNLPESVLVKIFVAGVLSCLNLFSCEEQEELISCFKLLQIE